MRESERAELAYMARADRPLWKGCLPDGGTDSDIPRWLAQGLVERSGDAGFVITDKGLAAIRSDVCPTCGQKRPEPDGEAA
jgi:hypothetical protein